MVQTFFILILIFIIILFIYFSTLAKIFLLNKVIQLKKRLLLQY